MLAVAKMLGHSDPALTLRVYAHPLSSDKDALAQAISGKFAKIAKIA